MTQVPLANSCQLIYQPSMIWNEQFMTLFDRCVAAYRSGNRQWQSYYAAADVAWLESIGCQSREFFDYVEDFCDEGEPSATTALLIAAVRRDFLLSGPHDDEPARVVTRDDLPTFGDELAGMAYLPRILAKARGKLRGQLDPDVMFGCGGDRHFLKNHGDIHPADFLRRVWACRDDDLKLAAWVKQQGEKH